MPDDKYGKDGRSISNFDDQNRPGDPNIRDRAGVDLRSAHASANGLAREFSAEMEALSPEGRREVEDLIRAADIQTNRELTNQKRARGFREMSEQVRRYQELLNHPDLKLGEVPFDGPGEIKHIQETSRRHVADREKFFIDKIERDARYDIGRVVQQDHERSAPSRVMPNPAQDQDQDPEH